MVFDSVRVVLQLVLDTRVCNECLVPGALCRAGQVDAVPEAWRVEA